MLLTERSETVWARKLPVGKLQADNEVVVVPEIVTKKQMDLWDKTSGFALRPWDCHSHLRGMGAFPEQDETL